jgi:hypothetical protein
MEDNHVCNFGSIEGETMKRWTVVAVLVGLLSFQAAAQDESWKLRTPTAKEYLSAIPPILDIGYEEARSLNYPSLVPPIYSTLLTEIYDRYSPLETEDPVLLDKTYYSFRENNDYWDDRDIWIHAIVLAWINQHSIELGHSQTLHFLNFEVQVTPRDFDMNADPEWLLHVENGDFTQDIVLAGNKENYRLVESPLPCLVAVTLTMLRPTGLWRNNFSKTLMVMDCLSGCLRWEGLALIKPVAVHFMCCNGKMVSWWI